MIAQDLVLVDTSIWADHIDHSDATLERLLDDGLVLMHPYVIGELAMGNLKKRDVIVGALQKLPHVIAARDQEVLGLVSSFKLFGRGIGWIDAHLLAATQLTPWAKLWTRDRRLREVAEALGLAFAK